jgi:hypothetical protein
MARHRWINLQTGMTMRPVASSVRAEDVLAVCLSIDAAFSELDFGGMSEVEFRQELKSAIPVVV